MYNIANHERFLFSYVSPRILLSLNLLCKHYNCEPLNTFTARRHQPNARKNNKQVLVFKHVFINLWEKGKQHKMPLFNLLFGYFFFTLRQSSPQATQC